MGGHYSIISSNILNADVNELLSSGISIGLVTRLSPFRQGTFLFTLPGKYPIKIMTFAMK